MSLKEAIGAELESAKRRIKGVPFVDSPQPDIIPEGEQLVVITASEYKRLLAGQSYDARIALVISGAALALALFGVANIWR